MAPIPHDEPKWMLYEPSIEEVEDPSRQMLSTSFKLRAER